MRPWGRVLVAVPLALIVLICLADLLAPSSVQLGSLLVIAPALTAAFTGPRLTALVGALAVGALEVIDGTRAGLTTANHMAQLLALVALSALMVGVSYVRERRAHQLLRTRSVSETAQRVLLRPPRPRIGPLRVAWLYLAAEDEAQIGGDLFATARGPGLSTRVVIGDVRGSGITSMGEASVVLGAFREGAHRHASLPGLATALEDSVCRETEEVSDTRPDPGEHFVTALLLDIPDHDPKVSMVSCGHPPPLLVHDRRVSVLDPTTRTPPLGLCVPAAPHRTDTYAFETGDIILLYTDGVIEARSPAGDFYPLAERLGALTATTPDTLLRDIHRDLLRHIGGEPTDDTALLAIQRLPD